MRRQGGGDREEETGRGRQEGGDREVGRDFPYQNSTGYQCVNVVLHINQ